MDAVQLQPPTGDPTSRSNETPLLGRLAATPWLRRHGEVLAVQALAFVLEDAHVRGEVLEACRAASGAAFPDLALVAEETVDDGTRPDLRGLDDEGRARLIIEAKFTHLITSAQCTAYLTDLAVNGSGQPAALIMLVPEGRRGEANSTLDSSRPALMEHVRAGVLTWDELLDAAQVGASTSRQRGDLDQLRALCRTYAGLDVAPFTDDEVSAWPPTRVPDLETLVDRATRLLTLAAGHPVLPIQQQEAPGFRSFRYVVPVRHGANMAVGLRHQVPHGWPSTALWLRYHSRTPLDPARRAAAIAGDAVANGARVAVFVDEGHLFIPLRVPVGVPGQQAAARLARCAARLHTAITGEPFRYPTASGVRVSVDGQGPVIEEA